MGFRNREGRGRIEKERERQRKRGGQEEVSKTEVTQMVEYRYLTVSI